MQVPAAVYLSLDRLNPCFPHGEPIAVETMSEAICPLGADARRSSADQGDCRRIAKLGEIPARFADYGETRVINPNDRGEDKQLGIDCNRRRLAGSTRSRSSSDRIGLEEVRGGLKSTTPNRESGRRFGNARKTSPRGDVLDRTRVRP